MSPGVCPAFAVKLIIRNIVLFSVFIGGYSHTAFENFAKKVSAEKKFFKQSAGSISSRNNLPSSVLLETKIKHLQILECTCVVIQVHKILH